MKNIIYKSVQFIAKKHWLFDGYAMRLSQEIADNLHALRYQIAREVFNEFMEGYIGDDETVNDYWGWLDQKEEQ